MITLQTLLTQLKSESLNEIVAGCSPSGSPKTKSTKTKSTKVKSTKVKKVKSTKSHGSGCGCIQ